MTDQRKLEAANAQLAAIVESSEDAIIGESLNGIITTWTKGAEHISIKKAHGLLNRRDLVRKAA